jgi:hypothetical protein
MYDDKPGKTVDVMSNGGSYTKDDKGKWCIV